jgi:hypothetical protein
MVLPQMGRLRFPNWTARACRAVALAKAGAAVSNRFAHFGGA